MPVVDSASQTYQPLTSYRWTKRGTNPNPFAAQRETRLALLEGNLARATTAAQREPLRVAIEETHYEITQLHTNSFLVGAADPFIVIPGSVYGQKDDAYSPGIGDYCAVIYGDRIFPAVVGDVGPLNKIGEASLRIAQEINVHATSENRPVSPLKVTYLIFPGSADHPFAPPDLAHWHDRVDGLLKEIGGYNGQLFVWKDITTPPPTPTPSPTPVASPSASPAASPVASPAASSSQAASP